MKSTDDKGIGYCKLQHMCICLAKRKSSLKWTRVVKTLFGHRRKENVQFRWTIVYLNSSF